MSANFALCTCYIEQLVTVILSDNDKAARKKKKEKAMKKKKKEMAMRKKKLPTKKTKSRRKKPACWTRVVRTRGMSVLSAFMCIKI